MRSKLYRYILLSIVLILTSCVQKYSFNIDNTDPNETATIEVDKRIQFKAIDGEKVNFKGEKPYFITIEAGKHTLTVFYSNELKKDNEVYIETTHEINFPVTIEKGKKYNLFAEDNFDRLKENPESSELKDIINKDQTFIVHYFLKAPLTKTQQYKSLCNLDQINYKNIKCLVKNKENLDRRYGKNRDLAIIHFVVLKKLKDSLRLLLKNGADVNRKSRAKEFTPLHYATSMNNFPVVKILVKNGADVNEVDKDKATPLHYAAANGFYKIANYLKKNGADINKKDKKGKKPVDWAKAKKQKRVAGLLEKKTTKKAVRKLVKTKKKKTVAKKKAKKKVKKKSSKVKRKKKKKKKKKKKQDEEDTLPERSNPIPAKDCSTPECYAAFSDSIETALNNTKYSKLETKDLRKVAYIYFQISKLIKRSTPYDAVEEFSKASSQFKQMKFGKKKLSNKRKILISNANNHVTKAAQIIVDDANRKLRILEENKNLN
ncbi:MAG: ankyrin repeat domain-containing protein [Desulfobacterales bacterium]|nr:ankyrin repeat domain-containing protein [Desulfobacterales bacterium]